MLAATMTRLLSNALDALRSALRGEESLVVLPPAEHADVEAFEQRTRVVRSAGLVWMTGEYDTPESAKRYGGESDAPVGFVEWLGAWASEGLGVVVTPP
jgi:hypothetical protein